MCFPFARFKIAQRAVASVHVGGPFLNFLPVIPKEQVKRFEKGVDPELLLQLYVQVFWCPGFLLYASEVKREKRLNLIVGFIKLKQFVMSESLSFSEK